MRLVSAYISSFGKIKDETFTFEDGLNVIFGDNGWGKSTLAAFIKIMFYGIKDSRETKVLVERHKFMPWDGSVCSGNLVFSHNDKSYQIERRIGRNKKDDIYKIIDVATGLETEDFDVKSPIGEQIFKVDVESFEKSVYVGQNAIETGLTNIMSAKMGDVAAAKGDIDNYDKAKDNISKARSSLKTRDKELDTEQKNLKKIYEREKDIKREIQEKRDIITENANLLEEIEKLNQVLDTRIASLASRLQLDGEYKAKYAQLLNRQEELEELDDFFAGGMPDDDEQNQYGEVERSLEIGVMVGDKIKASMPSEERIEELQNLFGGGMPDDGIIEEWKVEANAISELRAKTASAGLSDDMTVSLAELRSIFANYVPTYEDIDVAENRSKDIIRMETEVSILENNENKVRSRMQAMSDRMSRATFSGLPLTFIVLGFVSLIAAIALFIHYPQNINFIVAIAAVIFLVLGFVLMTARNTGIKRERKLLQVQLNDARHAKADALARLNEANQAQLMFMKNFNYSKNVVTREDIIALRTKLDLYYQLIDEEKNRIELKTASTGELTERTLALYTSLGPYASKYGIDLYAEENEATVIDKIVADKMDYNAYLSNQIELDENFATQRMQTNSLEDYIARFPNVPGDTYHARLTYIREQIERYKRLSKDIYPLQEEVDQLKVQIDKLSSDIGPYSEETEDVSIESLQAQRADNDSRIAEINALISLNKTKSDELSDDLEEVLDAHTTYEQITDERMELKNRISIFDDTLSYLEEAKNTFISRYMKPLNDRMKYYLKKMDKDFKDDNIEYSVELSINLDVSIKYGGVSVNPSKTAELSRSYLSQGYDDLIGLCARFALVDVLYENDRPMVILDDPFTNLDDNKIKSAMKLIKELGKDRQIMYFTCHESRVPSV